ncbi:iron ABC transporter permease [Balneolaceae bacterium YR4-1]|uniref:Iron ABC transporter permease n=2 Tax=Halalkalibaculum roseum TaxID=2709311 RepID=A0A6M1SVL5_9BACT|nr:iron ABC transporter permease [Halalkalibaculum roseum]
MWVLMSSSEVHTKHKWPDTTINTGYLLLLVAGVAVLFLGNIALGSVSIPIGDIINILFRGESDNAAWVKIIENIRIPRAFTAILAGSALSVGGLLMQTLFRNPLAGPSVLGITAGASLGVAIVMLTAGTITSIFAIQQLGSLGSWMIIVAASIGSAAVLLLILLISMRIRDSVTLLIIGLMIGNMTIALVSIWQYFSNPEQIRDYLIWTFGSLGGVTSGQLWLLTPVVVVGSFIAFGLSKNLNGMLLGENYARSMGLSVQRSRIWIILSTSLLAGGVTAFCGPIGFVGVAVPHLTRSLLNTNEHRILIPATFLMGAMLMLACDIVAQVPGSSTTLPISAVTSMVGSPVVIWVIIKRKNLQASFS